MQSRKRVCSETHSIESKSGLSTSCSISAEENRKQTDEHLVVPMKRMRMRVVLKSVSRSQSS